MATVADLITDARTRVTHLTPTDVAAEVDAGDVLLVDLREPGELDASGILPGAVHAPRGMLEFWADPASPYHRSEFDPDRRTVLYCSSGGRSALAAAALQDLGYRDVAHLDGGITGWLDAGQPTVAPGTA